MCDRALGSRLGSSRLGGSGQVSARENVYSNVRESSFPRAVSFYDASCRGIPPGIREP